MAVHLTCSSLEEALHMCQVSNVGVVCYNNHYFHKYAGNVYLLKPLSILKVFCGLRLDWY